MNNPLRSLLLAVFVALATLPGLSRAASGDYVSLAVPDLPQAVRFFHDVMNCDVIAADATVVAPSAAMLDCGDGTTVELIHQSGTPARKPGISFTTDNAVAAAAWLRANRITVVGQPVRTPAGGNDEKTVVHFVAPWGQPMQLVSHGRPDESAGTQLAAQ